MKTAYIITNEELSSEYGLDLENYTLDSSFVSVIIRTALGKAITRILKLNDTLDYETDLEKTIDENQKLVAPFKKLQWQVIYNLLFLGDNDPIDSQVDDIICADMKLGKINGFQKYLNRR